jgi:hypothetical protein
MTFLHGILGSEWFHLLMFQSYKNKDTFSFRDQKVRSNRHRDTYAIVRISGCTVLLTTGMRFLFFLNFLV